MHGHMNVKKVKGRSWSSNARYWINKLPVYYEIQRFIFLVKFNTTILHKAFIC
jgi:hypothetical protein